MNFYLIGSLEGFNDLRFPNVEDWQNCMGHAEGLLKQSIQFCQSSTFGKRKSLNPSKLPIK